MLKGLNPSTSLRQIKGALLEKIHHKSKGMEIDHFRVASMNLTWIWQRQDHQEIDRHQVKHKRIENQHPQFIDRTIFSIIQNHVGQGQQKCQERKELNSRFNSRDIPHCVSFFSL